MIDHIGFSVSDLARSKRFYLAALRPLGLEVVREAFSELASNAVPFVCFGTGHPCFCIHAGPAVSPPIHLAFAAHDRRMVDAFHAAALAAGGIDNGKPGIRPQYHPDYYGAFVRDPDGHNIEAVCHSPE